MLSKTVSRKVDKLLIVTIMSGLGVMFYFLIYKQISELFLNVAYTKYTNYEINYQINYEISDIVLPGLIFVSLALILLSFRTVLFFLYRESAPADFHSAPAMTVIIPAYNEGKMVKRTVNSVISANYPHDRLEIFIIDDGSSDNTWEYISEVASCHLDFITPIRFSENKGKRAALEAGFLRAQGEIAVTIDSDSIIEPQTLLELAGPFRDHRVGAVAGKVAAYNRYKGIIPRMLHVRFILSFDMLRAIQSTYNTVYCCPGALSAYRLSSVHKVLERWCNQTFLGEVCTIGEDRALTNLILEQGLKTIYQRKAVVHTIVPETYVQLTKMFLRWDRGDVREEWRLLTKSLWQRPWRTRWISIIDVFFANLRYPMIIISLGLIITLVFDPFIVFQMIVVIGFIALFYMLFYLICEKSMDFMYGIVYAYFSFFTLFWVFPYAVMTLRNRSWLTR